MERFVHLLLEERVCKRCSNHYITIKGFGKCHEGCKEGGDIEYEYVISLPISCLYDAIQTRVNKDLIAVKASLESILIDIEKSIKKAS